jgi:excisionase family DNA binding protein
LVPPLSGAFYWGRGFFDNAMISDRMAQRIMGLPSILSIKEVAVFFSVNYLTVYRLIRGNDLQAYKDDEGNWCIARMDLMRYCSKNCNV